MGRCFTHDQSLATPKSTPPGSALLLGGWSRSECCFAMDLLPRQPKCACWLILYTSKDIPWQLHFSRVMVQHPRIATGIPGRSGTPLWSKPTSNWLPDAERVVVGGESAGGLLILRLASLHPEIAAILCYAPAIKLSLNWVKEFLLSLCAPFITSIPKPPSTDNNPWQGYSVNPLKAADQLRRLQKVHLSPAAGN